MNLKQIKIGVLAFASIALVCTSCSEDDANDATDNSADLIAEQSKQAAETDETSTEVFSIIENAYVEQEEEFGREVSFFPDCVTIIVSSENGNIFIDLDFGEGCQLNNGHWVSGILHITYGAIQNGTRTLNYSFENFTFNNKGIEGGGTVFREYSNAAGNRQSTFHKNIEVSFEDGRVANVDGVRVREWVEGQGSGTWMDNVYEVTGNWEIVFNTGFSRTAIVTEVLRREATCLYFVSGTLDVTRSLGEGVFDFGNGECDNKATLTVNGIEHSIILGY